MNKNSPKRFKVVSLGNNADETDLKKRKLEEEHQNSSSCVNSKYDVQFCKMNAEKMFQNETFPTFNDLDKLGKS